MCDKVFVGIQVKKCPYFLVNGEIEIQCCHVKRKEAESKLDIYKYPNLLEYQKGNV